MVSDRTAGLGASRRSAIVIILLLAAALAAWWILRPAPGGLPTPRTEQITLATFSKALANAPYHVARRRRMFEQDPRLANIRISYAEFNDRPAIATAFSSGNLDLLFSAEIPSILIRAQGEDVRIVAASTYAFQEIVVPTQSNIRAVNDLRGRRVAVLAGTSSHYALLRILAAANLTPQDVNLVFMPAAEGQAAFERGDLDGWAVWAPFVEIQEVAGRGRTLQGSEAVINSVGTMSNRLIRTDPTVAAALVDIIARAKAWIIAHPDEAQRIMAEDLGFDLEVVRGAWPKFHWDATVDERMIADFEAKARFLAEQRLSRDNIAVNIRRDMLALDVASSQAR
jgi:sulfonate transport system substrate-binding protein